MAASELTVAVPDAYIRELAVRRRGWLDEATFNDGLVLAQSLPGATAMQCVAYVGLRVRGVGGALVAYLAFGLPAFVILLVLAVAYAATRDVASVVTLLAGLQLIVVAIVAAATLSFGRAALTDRRSVMLAAAALGLYAWGMHPVVVVLGAGVAGALWLRPGPSGLHRAGNRVGRTARSAILVVCLLAAGLLALWLTDPGLFALAFLMLETNLLAFGGGFASLPVLLHEIVGVHGWMDQRTFMDGIAIRHVTPGPILITATFIGYQLFGLVGAVVATVAMFSPSFVLLIAVAPYLQRFASSGLYAGVARAVSASFVGLLCYVGGSFAADVQWDLPRLILAAVAFVALARRVVVLYVVLAGGVISLVVR